MRDERAVRPLPRFAVALLLLLLRPLAPALVFFAFLAAVALRFLPLLSHCCCYLLVCPCCVCSLSFFIPPVSLFHSLAFFAAHATAHRQALHHVDVRRRVQVTTDAC
jgi:hypothetical protein